jgi:dihydroorotate dehydrogenase
MSVVAETEPKVPIWVKLSPCLTLTELKSLANRYPEFDFTDVPTFEEGFDRKIIELVARYPFVRAVVLNNTLPNVRRIENGHSVTTPNDGKAGMSGPAMLEITRRSVVNAGWLLAETDIDIIASGGIMNGDNAAELLELGAAAVACTSGPVWSGPRFFADMLQSERLQNFLTRNA